MESRQPRRQQFHRARSALDPTRAAILTDVDGTLAPIAERPELVEVPAARADELCRAQRALRAGRLHLRAPGGGGAAVGRPRRDRLRRQPRPRAAPARRGRAPPRSALDRPRARRRRVHGRLDGGGAGAARDPGRGQGRDRRPALARRRDEAAAESRATRSPTPRRQERPGTALGPQGAGAAAGGRGRQGRGGRLAAQRGQRSRPPSTPATTAPTSTPSGRLGELRESGRLATAVRIGDRSLRRHRRSSPRWPT